MGLEHKLILCLILSFCLSIGIFFLLETPSMRLLEDYLNKTSFEKIQKMQAISDFKSYVSANKLSIKDQDKITKWEREKKYVKLYIFKDNRLVYDLGNSNSANGDDYFGEDTALPQKSLYDIVFSDTNAKLYVESFFAYKYFFIADLVCLLFSFFCFISIMLLFFKQKMTYIKKLENEIKILEGGNLTYEITIKGNDELSSLAQSINEMRKSFIEQMESADKAKSANNELITAMSHDLRTPLTALIGYLDIIEYKKYKTNENLSQYIHNSREKASQIKSLSDKLFEYFTAFNNYNNFELQTFDGDEIFEQLLDEQILILEDNGFFVQVDHSCNKPYSVNLNLISIRRVFDNIFSNVTKYADNSKPINIKFNTEIEKQLLFVYIENEINNNLNQVESTGLGLKICENIIKCHNGELAISKTDRIFSVLIKLPIK